MSRNEWEHGTIKLPSAAVPKVKKAVRDAHNQSREAAKQAAKQFWQTAAKRTRSPAKYREAVDQYMDDLYRRREPRGFSSWSSLRPEPFEAERLHWMLNQLADRPRQVTEADLDRHFGPKATNRTCLFRVGEATITFDGNDVTWDVPENNHAVDHAHRHPVAKALFQTLGQVTWTRGTGGQIVGNDEYNRDSNWAGGGANYVTEGFGPLGNPDYQMARSMAHARSRPTATGGNGRGSNQYRTRR